MKYFQLLPLVVVALLFVCEQVTAQTLGSPWHM